MDFFFVVLFCFHIRIPRLLYYYFFLIIISFVLNIW